jgi:hypothetical protein
MTSSRRRSQRTTSRSTTTRPPANLPPGPTAEDAAQAAVDWDREYAYISKDLRQLAIVSTALFAALLILGWFI